jgi:hypothetical protein
VGGTYCRQRYRSHLGRIADAAQIVDRALESPRVRRPRRMPLTPASWAGDLEGAARIGAQEQILRRAAVDRPVDKAGLGFVGQHEVADLFAEAGSNIVSTARVNPVKSCPEFTRTADALGERKLS